MDNLEYERKYLSLGKKYIAGVDEVGRGPLAGPVVCCAVIMPLDDLIEGVTDSKKIPEKKRENAVKSQMHPVRSASFIQNSVISHFASARQPGRPPAAQMPGRKNSR